jgi:P4 family phage/plasmid primase-like protien
MNTLSQYKDLNDFLSKHNAKNDKGGGFTHTRIGDKELNIFAGSYLIPNENLKTFYHLYHDHVFVKKKKEYLTEKQLENGACMAVDFDFRYDYTVEERKHTKEHIQDMVLLYLEELKQYFVFEENKPFDIFIFEKPHVNRVEDKNITKDGIHMLICFQVDHVIQTMIREKIITKMHEIWGDLPLINDWDSVLDEGISKGKTNWQLFGSRKPGNENYEFVQHFVITYDSSDGEFMMDEMNVANFDLKNNFYKLSVQNINNPKFDLNPKIKDDYQKRLENKNKSPKTKKTNTKTKVKLLIEDGGDESEQEEDESILLSEITNKEMLNRAVNMMLSKLKPDEYELKETHDYTQILPEKYYAPGSHLLNRQVAFALKNTDERLFLSWVQLRSKAADFDYSTIPSLYHDWKKYFNIKEQLVTRRSIIYWAKQDAYDDYVKVKESTIDHYMEETIYTQTDFDLAFVLYQIFKDKYVCISYVNKGIWYVFKNHRWEPDKGVSLRLAISKDMYNVFNKKNDLIMNEYQNEPNEEKREFLSKKSKGISNVLLKLKRTSDKNNIMREAMELFYDNDFIKCMDTNKYLLCFNNGVVDFKNKIFRNGYPQDYITKTTGINYQEYDHTDKKLSKIGEELISFMEKLFPIPSLNKYMWDHLSSCLIGGNINQTFNIYHGSGSNGKSILTDLMSYTLGEYKGIVPITLVTEKRNNIGATSSELIQLKGVRYAVMQEPSKGVKLNEGIMKELTGGDPLQARALFQECETFETQFKLVVCTNNLFDIESNDDGTWRRIRKCDFLSKFIDEDETHTDHENPYVFQKDKSLKERLPQLAPVFASMLVKRAFETNGIVEDCDIVMSASNKYRKGQDHIAAFVSEKIEKIEGHHIGQRGLAESFKLWFTQEQGTQKLPKLQELYDYMDKKFGNHKNNPKRWMNIDFIKQEEEDIIETLQSQSC